MASLSIEPRPKGTLIIVWKVCNINVAARKGQHMEYAGNVTQESSKQNKAITTCIYGLVESSMVTVLHKANFPYYKGINLINYHGGC